MGQKENSVLFLETDHNFGEIEEAIGIIEYDFVFVNLGNNNLNVNEVTTSCGCTAPSYPSTPIAVGDSGTITVRLDVTNIPGKFHKSISVETDGHPALSILNIEGFVVPTPKTLEEEYPYSFGDIRTSILDHNFGKIHLGSQPKKKIKFINTSEKIQRLTVRWRPDHIEMGFDSVLLRPQERLSFYLRLDPKLKGQLGTNSDLVILNDGYSDHQIRITSFVEEKFDLATMDTTQLPKLTFSKTSHDFVETKQGSIVTHEFDFQNIGKNSLNVRAVRSNCHCLVASLKKRDFEAGESGKLKVTFDTNGRKGNQYMPISVFSNDPFNPTQILLLMGKIKE